MRRVYIIIYYPPPPPSPITAATTDSEMKLNRIFYRHQIASQRTVV